MPGGGLRRLPRRIRALYEQNFTWRGAAAATYFLIKEIPDGFGRRDFWSNHLPMLWKLVLDNSTTVSVAVVGLIILLDHNYVIKRQTKSREYDLTTLKGRTLQFCETLRKFHAELGPEPKLNYASGMSQAQFNEANMTAAHREQTMHHGFQLRYAEHAARLWHEHGQELREDVILGDALAGRIDHDDALELIINRFTELAEMSANSRK